MQPVRPPLEDADLVVQALDEAKGYLVLGTAVEGDAVPVVLDYPGEPLVGFEALPLERLTPLVQLG